MEVEVKLELKDWYAFQGFLLARARKQNNTLKSFLKELPKWVLIALLGIFILSWISPVSENGFDWPTAFIVIAFFILVVIIYMHDASKLRKALEPSMEGAFGCVQKYSFNENGFVIEADGYRVEHVWPFVMHIEREAGMLMLFIDTAQAYVLPVKKLQNPDELYEYIVQQYTAATS